MTFHRSGGTNDYKNGRDSLSSPDHRLGALASIAARIGVYQDTRRLAREAMQAIADILPIKAAFFLLSDSNTNSLVFHEGYNLPVEETQRLHTLISWDDCIEGEVVRGEKSILIEDVSTETRAIHYQEGSMSLGLVPLLIQERAIGVLSVTTAAPHKLDQSDMEFLLTLGSQLGIYLENARLLEELKESNKQLLLQNQDLEELLSVISHDLRSPLATIGGYASLMIKKGEELKSEERIAFAETIFRKTKETSRRFDDLLAVFKTAISQKDEAPEELDSRVAIEEALEEAGQDQNTQRFTIEIPDHLPRLLGYYTHLLHLFTNIFSNSFKFIGAQEEPRITVDYEKVTAADEINHRFLVTDNGMGISADYIANIFRPFTRVPGVEDISGTGVGLASVQRIVRSHKGTVDIVSTEGEGTTITFALPWKEVEKTVESEA
ncbi:MAG: ATP-binding protein [bacterium]|nr:ATP-binding protein [bacterium]MDT8365574.1 ATP-binding protein [bacterium]